MDWLSEISTQRHGYENHAILRYSLSNLCGTKCPMIRIVLKIIRFGTEIEPDKITKTMSNVDLAPSAIHTLV